MVEFVQCDAAWPSAAIADGDMAPAVIDNDGVAAAVEALEAIRLNAVLGQEALEGVGAVHGHPHRVASGNPETYGNSSCLR